MEKVPSYFATYHSLFFFKKVVSSYFSSLFCFFEEEWC
jgi:hypothetical protein